MSLTTSLSYHNNHIIMDTKQQKQQYDSFSSEYHVYTTEHPWCTAIFYPSIAKMIGDVREKKVLDLACGDGGPSCKIKKWGASKVVGVDISAGMFLFILSYLLNYYHI